MVIECLKWKYNCGTPFVLAFYYKIEHKNKISECACGGESLSEICISGAASQISGTVSRIRETTPKFSSSGF